MATRLLYTFVDDSYKVWYAIDR